MAKRIYISGRSTVRDGVESAIKTLRDSGFEITFDWTKFPRIIYKDEPERAKEYSLIELAAIDSADVFILISDEAGTGMYVEMGYAIAKGKSIYVVGEWNTKPMFMYHPHVIKLKTIEAVISKISV